jgi:hypothetical protein
MTAPLRRAHRRIWLALAIVLPLILASGLYLAQSPPAINAHWEISR